eukprot:NODE_859_length_1858_cov_31.003317_g770_i0.p1 GENE.NODE_859_length_1858_cov_31.003317_g770_i0~~NODE_859_length_1858_cov_31.003317_g770_i0.p1  ORF type:complete len:416 (+),score=42.61 NODE_859_length_1858_cov_31.003317_g770_i0:163-1410(+)
MSWEISVVPLLVVVTLLLGIRWRYILKYSQEAASTLACQPRPSLCQAWAELSAVTFIAVWSVGALNQMHFQPETAVRLWADCAAQIFPDGLQISYRKGIEINHPLPYAVPLQECLRDALALATSHLEDDGPAADQVKYDKSASMAGEGLRLAVFVEDPSSWQEMPRLCRAHHAVLVLAQTRVIICYQELLRWWDRQVSIAISWVEPEVDSDGLMAHLRPSVMLTYYWVSLDADLFESDGILFRMPGLLRGLKLVYPYQFADGSEVMVMDTATVRPAVHRLFRELKPFLRYWYYFLIGLGSCSLHLQWLTWLWWLAWFYPLARLTRWMVGRPRSIMLSFVDTVAVGIRALLPLALWLPLEDLRCLQDETRFLTVAALVCLWCHQPVRQSLLIILLTVVMDGSARSLLAVARLLPLL